MRSELHWLIPSVMIALVSICFAQPTKPLKNDDIKQMVAGGLSDDTIARPFTVTPASSILL